MENQEVLFNELIVAAGRLATVTDNAAVILSEQFEDMVRPFVDEVRAILARCPQPITEWDGKLRDADILVTHFEAPAPQGDKHFGVELQHAITGIKRQSYTKPTEEENYAVARGSLQRAVEERYQTLQK